MTGEMVNLAHYWHTTAKNERPFNKRPHRNYK
jgi:hypothetical protein